MMYYFGSMRGDEYLATNLQVAEFASHSTGLSRLYSPYVFTDERFLYAWENMEEVLEDPYVYCGYRNIDHNLYLATASNGDRFSQHKAGLAADIMVPEGEGYDYMLLALNEWGFQGSYVMNSDTTHDSIHIDTRYISGYPNLYPGGPLPYVVPMEDGLRYHGYYIGVNGTYLYSEDTYVKSFQTNKGLTPDGIVGPLTWDKICIEP